MHVGDAYAEIHAGPRFLPWHRAYMLDLERELQKIDPSVALHYWRFDQRAPRVFRRNFMGAMKPANGAEREAVFNASNPLSAWATNGRPGIFRYSTFDTVNGSPGPAIRGSRVSSACQPTEQRSSSGKVGASWSQVSTVPAPPPQARQHPWSILVPYAGYRHA